MDHGNIPGRRGSISAWVLVAVVLGLTFAAYGRSLGFQFVSDDIPIIVNNRRIQSWHYLPQYFTENVWAGAQDPGTAGSYYRPVFLIWLRLNDALFGTAPAGWHLTTVLMHVLATLLVYLLVLRLAEDSALALMAALIFGVHPSHIEVVAWVNGVSESLLGVLLLGSFLLYLKKQEAPHRLRVWRLLSLLLYGLALLAKETALLFPLVIVAYNWTRPGRTEGVFSARREAERIGRALWSSGAYFLMVGAYLAVRLSILKAFSRPSSLSLAAQILTWPSLAWFYIRHLFVPVGIASAYDLDYVHAPHLRNFWLPLLGSLLVIAALVAWARKSPLRTFALVWTGLFLLPVFDLRALAPFDFAHDRFLYLPSVGFAILVASALKQIPSLGRNLKFQAWPQFATAGALGLSLAAATAYQSFYFASDWIYFRYNYLLAPNNPYAAVSYGGILLRRGEYAESIQVLERVAQNHPESWIAVYNLGLDYFLQGRSELAGQCFEKVKEIQPDTPEKNIYLGWGYLDLGRVDKAIEAFRTAIRLYPSGEGYHYALGMALEARGDLRGALQEFQTELANDPGRPELRAKIAVIKRRLSRSESPESDHHRKP